MKRLLRKLAGRWWIKVTAQNMLGLLPFGLGLRANQKLVDLLQGPVEVRPGAGEYRILRSVRNFDLLIEHSGTPIQGLNVLELGTGWRGADAILFYLYGARSVLTLDHQPWLQAETFRRSALLIASMFERLAPQVGRHTPSAEQRLRRLKDLCSQDLSLQEMLEALNIRYLIGELPLLERLDLEEGSIGLFYSESVLQRIPVAKLERGAGYICTRLLSDGGLILHRTDSRDIHTQQHVGNQVWAFHYLRYGDFVFNTFLNGRFTSQNRLRESDFLELFQDNGIQMLYIESRVVKDDLAILKEKGVHRKYAQKTAQDIVTRASILIGRKGRPADGSPHRKVIYGTIREVEQ